MMPIRRDIVSSILLFLTCHFLAAQTEVFVSNNANIAIYVDGTIFADATSNANSASLFVTDGIQLEGANSYIYLRNEAQLLQSNETAFNSGLGKLSVHQRGTVSATEYNYWCSPVGDPTTSSSVNNPFIPENSFYDQTAGPITSSIATFTTAYDGTSGPLVISNRWFYTFDPGTAYSEWDLFNEDDSVTSGYGFTMKGTNGSGSNQLYDFRGKANTGTMSIAVLNGDWTLTGNPYPSALDAADFIHDPLNTNLANSTTPPTTTGALYYWEQDPTPNSHYVASYVGGYATYTTSAPDAMDNSVDSYTPATFTTFDGAGNIIPLPPPGATGSKTARRYIPVGQGFMIEGNANGNVFITNAQRNFVKESSGSSFFFGQEEHNEQRTYTENGLNIVPEGFQRFRINVAFNDLYTRQLLMNLHDSATEGFDYGLEGKHPLLIDSDAYWEQDDIPYTIQALKYDLELRIPLLLTLHEEQFIRFRIFDVQHFDDAPIYLHDKDLNAYTNLREGYHEITLPSGDYSDRFEITFTMDDALNTPEVTLNDFQVFQNNNTANLTILNPNGLAIENVSLFDINGKNILNQRMETIENEYYISTKNLSSGVYLAKVTVTNSKTVSKKIIINN